MALSRPQSRAEGEPQHAERLEASAWPVRSSQVVSEAPRVGHEHLGALYAVVDWNSAGERGPAAASLAATTLVQRYYGGSADAKASLRAALDEAQGASQRLLGPSAASLRMLAIVVVGARAFAHGSSGFRAWLVHRGESLPFAEGRAELEGGAMMLAQLGGLGAEPHANPGEGAQALTRRLGAASDGATMLAVGFRPATVAPVAARAMNAPILRRRPAVLGVLTALVLASTLYFLLRGANGTAQTPTSSDIAPLETVPGVAQAGEGSPQPGTNTALQVAVAATATIAQTNTITPAPTRPLPAAVPAPTRIRTTIASPVQNTTVVPVAPAVGGPAPVEATPGDGSLTPTVSSFPTETPGGPELATTPTGAGVPTEAPTLPEPPGSTIGPDITDTPTEPLAETTPAVLSTATTAPPLPVEATTTAANTPAILSRQPVGRSAPVAVPIGGEIAFAVEGFGPHERLSVWATPQGRTSSIELAQVKVDVNGAATWKWPVPSYVVTGPWNMVAQNANGIKAVIHFEVIPASGS